MNTTESERICDKIEKLHQRKHQELKNLQSDVGEMVHIDAIWDLIDDTLNEVKDIASDTEEGQGESSPLDAMVRRRIQLDLDEQQINEIAEKVADNINEDLRDALKITQRSYTGNYKHGYMVRLTGEEMKAIQKAIESAA